MGSGHSKVIETMIDGHAPDTNCKSRPVYFIPLTTDHLFLLLSTNHVHLNVAQWHIIHALGTEYGVRRELYVDCSSYNVHTLLTRTLKQRIYTICIASIILFYIPLPYKKLTIFCLKHLYKHVYIFTTWLRMSHEWVMCVCVCDMRLQCENRILFTL